MSKYNYRGLIVVFLILFIPIHVYSMQKTAVVIPISGMIDYGLSVFVKRAVDSSRPLNPDIIIFEIDTFGGRVDAALEIVDTINAVSWAKTVAFVKTKAISAGALISLASNELVMVEGTTIGDCAPIISGSEGPKMLGEKFQSPLRAKFRSLAEKNGYPVKLAEAMVSQDIEVLEVETGEGKKIITRREFEEYSEKEKKQIISKKILLEKGKLLTMHAAESVRLGFAEFTVKDFGEFLEKYDIKKELLKTFNLLWSEKLVIFIDTIAPFLLIIGLGGLYLEARTPGIGLPGIIGVVCLSLVFGSKFFVGLANYLELFIFIIGVILIFIEVFVIPGFGITGISGIILVFISLLLSFQNFVIPEFPWEFEIFYENLLMLGTIFVANLLLIITSLVFGERALAGSRIAHRESEKTEDGFRSSEDYSHLLNLAGKSMTDLRPAGYVDINGIRTNVVSDGDFIPKGTIVKVINVTGNRIVVERG